MPRRPRLNLTGLSLHIIQRGNNQFREKIKSAMGRRGEPNRGGRPRRATRGIDGEQIEFGF